MASSVPLAKLVPSQLRDSFSGKISHTMHLNYLKHMKSLISYIYIYTHTYTPALCAVIGLCTCVSHYL